MDNQLYPTPEHLARKMWSMFQGEASYGGTLEPSAGLGNLVAAVKEVEVAKLRNPRWESSFPIDYIEIDPSNRAIIESVHKRVTHVGDDFLQFDRLAKYDRVIMNPPFSAGAQHLLHAWDGMYSGQIVCLLNAETVRNPHTAERKRLLKIIADAGTIEYVGAAFQDAERKTDVDCAIVHLTKPEPFAFAWSVNDFLKDAKADQDEPDANVGEDTDRKAGCEVMIPASWLEHQVRFYNEARTLAKTVFSASIQLNDATNRIGVAFHETQAKDDSKRKPLASRTDLMETLDELRNRAWTSVVRSSRIREQASEGVDRQIQAAFTEIAKLPFTLDNTQAFVRSIIEKSSSLHTDIICDAFDAFGTYHSGNRAWFKGWKSNDKHRLFGGRLKTTRIVIPHVGRYSSYQRSRKFDDMSRALSYFETGTLGSYGMSEQDIADATKSPGTRITARSGFFDLRWYAGTETLHVFPRRKDLIDKLNLFVAYARKWLPPEGSMEHAMYKAAYDASEKHADEFTAAIESALKGTYMRTSYILETQDDSTHQGILARMDVEAQAFYVKKGIWTSLPKDHAEPLLITAEATA